MRDIAFQKLSLVEHLERDDEFAFFLSRQVDMAKLATTKRFAYLEVIYGPLSAIKSLMSTNCCNRVLSQHWRPTHIVWSWCLLKVGNFVSKIISKMNLQTTYIRDTGEATSLIDSDLSCCSDF